MSNSVSRVRRPLPVRLVMAVMAVLSTVVVVGPARSADAAGAVELTISGGGWGHGRGMSQYGAYGYVADHNWTAERILSHYYGGTTAGRYPGGAINPDRLRVDLRLNIGRATRVQLGSGTIAVSDSNGGGYGAISGAVRVDPDSSGGLLVIQRADSCAGPWVEVARTSAERVIMKAQSQAGGSDGLLEVCGGVRTWYEGEIWSTIGNGYQRTINVVSVEQYLRGVVPNEMPASWPDEALKVQAVAARSYVLAGDPRRGVFSDTCDDVYCQVYDGRYTTRGGRFRSATDERSDRAVNATAGQVRLNRSGGVARTEFSSSTGGWTAGGDFPAVEDAGDDISSNPNHRWTVTRSSDMLESWYSQRGFRSINVVERTGGGPFGGRVVWADLVFETGTIRVSGNSLRQRLNLKSDLFEVSSEPVAVPYADEVNLAYQRYLDRAPRAAELESGSSLVARAGLGALTTALAEHPEFAGRLIDDLYRSALGRPADGGGRAYWVGRMVDGARYEAIGTYFYGSAEYYRRVGGTDEAFIGALYQEILGRPADAGGLRYWRQVMDRGASTSLVANSFYLSTESRRKRVRALGAAVLGRSLTAAEVDALVTRLVRDGDLAVAAHLGLWAR